VKRIVPLLLALLVGGLSLAMTFGLWTHERQSEQARLHAIFDFDLRRIVSRIEQRIASYEQMLRGMQGHFQTADHVDRVRFDRYVDSVMAGPEAAGLRALGYGPLLTADQLPAYVTARRAEGFADFTVHPPGKRDIYSPLTYLAPPRPENAGAFGFDGLADPVRRTTMMQARDSDDIRITRRLRLTIDSARMGSAYLMYLPVYRPGSAPATVAARRDAAVGWIAASFRIGDLMSALNGEEDLGLVLQLHDGADTGEASVTYRSGASSAIAPVPGRFAALEYLKIAGYVWTLQLRSLPEFERRHGQDAADVILAAGLVLSILTALLTFQLLTGRARATATAQAMTHELSESGARYRHIVETAGEGIWLCDATRRVSFTNARLARWLGWPEGEMLGRPIEDFMEPEQA
jgi:CHASE1-domain containing sensor protein